MLHRNRAHVAVQPYRKCSAQVTVSSQKSNDSDASPCRPAQLTGGGGAEVPLGAGCAGAAKALLPARNHFPVVDVVRNTTLESGDHRARGPGYALP